MAADDESSFEFEICRTGINKVLKWLGIAGISVKCFAIITSIHVGMIIIGSIYFKECPASPKIPIFMVGHGVVSIALELFVRFCNTPLIVSPTVLVQIGFFITGSVYIYGAFEPQYDPAYGDEYCKKTLYISALTIVSIVNGIVALGLFLLLCHLICSIVYALKDEDKGESTA